MKAETACPDASKFETFIPLERLVFEQELFKPPIDVSVFGSENPYHDTDCPQICTENDLHVPHLSSKIQVSPFNRFKVMAFFISGADFVILSGKKHRDFRREASRKSQKTVESAAFSNNKR